VSSDVLGYISYGAIFFSLGATGGALFTGLRSSSRKTVSSAAGLCASVAVLLLLAGGATYALGLSYAFSEVAHADPSEKASRLAIAISDAMNCVAFVIVSTAPPAIAAIVLLVRSRSLR
jgi:hypothetical protein